jgi:hypothetical protein
LAGYRYADIVNATTLRQSFDARGCSLKKILVHSPKNPQKTQKFHKDPKKSPQNPKIIKNPKNPTIFGGIY